MTNTNDTTNQPDVSVRLRRLDDKREALTTALELLDQLADELNEGGLLGDDHFRAYHVCQIEGREAGWLGGPFLVDAIRDELDALEDEARHMFDDVDDEVDEVDGEWCPTCGGLGTNCPDPNHGQPEPMVCGACGELIEWGTTHVCDLDDTVDRCPTCAAPWSQPPTSDNCPVPEQHAPIQRGTSTREAN